MPPACVGAEIAVSAIPLQCTTAFVADGADDDVAGPNASAATSAERRGKADS